MQLNAFLVRTQFIPYLYLISKLCFYRLLKINNIYQKNPWYIIAITDLIQIPLQLFLFLHFCQTRFLYLSKRFLSIYKHYY